MTLKEANIYGKTGSPIVFDGAEYKRIIRCGYYYSEDGEARGFVDIIEKNTGTIVTVRPEALSLLEKTNENKDTD